MDSQYMENNLDKKATYRESRNEFYKKHGSLVHSDPVRFSELAKLCKGKVLDVGCGTGDLADFYKGEYEGVDISDEAIEMAKDMRREDAIFKQNDFIKEYAIPLEKYDTIIMAEFLEHLENDEQVFKNIRQILKPTGRIIISVPNGDRVPDSDHKRTFLVPQLRQRFSEIGKVTFYNNPGFRHRIMMTIDLSKRNANLLSLVMIVKNEEWGLERAILSCIDFVDNIVISVDKDTTDDTLKIAERYADVIKEHEWADDFSAARNFAKENINTPWILSLDGHEYVEKHEGLEEKLREKIDALSVRMIMENSDQFLTTRLFKSHLNWEEPIHNIIRIKNKKGYEDFIIKHDREKGQSKTAILERNKQREEMMPKLLKRELKRKGDSTRAYFYLARWYFTQVKLKKAIKYYKKYLRKGMNKSEKWLCFYEASLCANTLGKQPLALKFLRKAEQILPNRWEIALQTGLTYMLFEQWKKAIYFLTDSFKINTGKFIFKPEEKNNANIWEKIGYCWFQIGDLKRAKVSWEEAIRSEKNPDQIKLLKKRIDLIDRNLITSPKVGK